VAQRSLDTPSTKYTDWESVYFALSVYQSSDYEVVKGAILIAYELISRVYCQLRRYHKEGHKNLPGIRRTSLIIGDVPRALIKSLPSLCCWKNSRTVYCRIPKCILMRGRGVWADDYALTHRGSFKKPLPPHGDNTTIKHFQVKTDNQLQAIHLLLHSITGIQYLKMVCLQDPFATTVSVEGMSNQSAKSCKRKKLNQ